MSIGDTFVWIGSLSGDWNTATNWQDVTSGADPAFAPPGPNDTAIFNTPVGQTQTVAAADTPVMAGTFTVGTVVFNGSDVVTGILYPAMTEVRPGATLVYNFFDGDLLIDSGGTVVGAGDVYLTNVVDNGTFAGENIIYDGSYAFPSGTISGTGVIEALDNGSIDQDFDTTGSKVTFRLDNDAQMTIKSDTTAAAIDMAGTGDVLLVENVVNAPLVGFDGSDVIMIRSTAVASAAYDQVTNTLTLSENGAVYTTLDLPGDFSGTNFVAYQVNYPVHGLSNTAVEIVLSLPFSGGGPSPGTATPDQYVWTGPLAGDWNNAANWSDITSGGSLGLVAPGINNDVTISGLSSGQFHFISGAGDAAELTLVGDSAVLGQINTGTLELEGQGSALEIESGATVTAGAASVTSDSTDMAANILVYGGGAALAVDGTFAMTPSLGALFVSDGGSVHAGNLVAGGIQLDATSSITVGDSEVGTPGDLTIGNGGALTLTGFGATGIGTPLGAGFSSPAISGVYGNVVVASGGALSVADPSSVEGTLTVNSGASVTGSSLVLLGPLVDNGTISTADLEFGSFSGAGVVEILNGGTLRNDGPIAPGTASFSLDGDGRLVSFGSIGAGNSISLGGTSNVIEISNVIGSLVVFSESPGGSDVEYGPSLPEIDATVSGFNLTDTIAVAGNIPIDSATLTAGMLTLFNDGTAEAAFQLADYPDPTGSFVVEQVSASEWDVTAACFAAGTRIATARGAIAAEDLREGDVVLTVSGGRQQIQWIGRRHIKCSRHTHPERVMPIRIAPHAFGEGRPARVVLLSPDHSVFLEDVLIPIRFLVNDSTVAQIKAESITYYHIELPQHDVVLAEGLPVESYLETGGRSTFENGGGALQLYPDLAPNGDQVAMMWESFAYAPLLGDGRQLERARMKLRWQAELLEQRAAS
jgi:hypothetical protein